jgi:undecaprenyl-diphosphatase
MAAQDAEHGMDRPQPLTREPARARTDGEASSGGFDLRPLIGAIGLAGFAVLTVLIASKVAIPFDQQIFDAAQGLGQYMTAWQDLSQSANLPLIAIGTGIVLWLLYKRQWREAILVIIVLALVTAGSEAVKVLVSRPRPPGYNSSVLGVVYSYPSGHVLEAITIYGIIAVLVWRSSLAKAVRVIVPIIFTIIIVLVAIARVATGDHYPSDVLAGVLAGVAFVALFSWLTDLLARRRATKHA